MSTLKISIKNPCSENWDSFEKHGNNGFCLSCQKDVIDFTKYSDQKIIEYFKKHAFDKTCGRLRSSQLKTYTVPKKKRDLRAIAALLTAGILTIVNPPESKATPIEYEVISSKENKDIDKDSVRTSSLETKRDSIEIKGKVIAEEDDVALPGVNVVIKGTAMGTQTDENGNFVLNYDANSGERIFLTFSFVGLQTTEQEVVLSGDKDVGTIRIGMDVTRLGDICVPPWYSPRRWWWGITDLFRR